MFDFIYYAASFLAVVVVLTLHEFSHAFVAYKCGDPTPKWNGRLTLNPLRHFDITGLICFTLVGFGWAKPVPINPQNFKRYRLGSALTAVAGVATNFLTAGLIFYPLSFFATQYYFETFTYFSQFLYYLANMLFAYSLSFCVFNLLPFYPLDGFRLIEPLWRGTNKIYQFLRKNSYYFLLFLIIESFICDLFVRFGIEQMAAFDILGYIMSFATNIIGWPIRALWGLIL